MKKILVVLLIVIALVLSFFLGQWHSMPQAVGPAQNPSTVPAGAVATPINVLSLNDAGSTSTPMITLEYPQFPSANSAFNQAISSSTLGLLAQFRQESSSNESAREANGAPAMPLSSYTFNASWENVQANSQYVSFIERYSYWDGGANGDNELQTFNYNVQTGQIMTLADLFPNVPDYLQRIARASQQQLSENLNASGAENSFLTEMINEGTEPTADNFQYFTFTNSSITLYFPECSVAACSYGEQKVTLPRDISSL